MRKKLIAVLLAATMAMQPVSAVGAESLEERITALEQRVAELEAMVGVQSAKEDTTEIASKEAAVSETEEAEVSDEPVLMETQQFLDDIVASYNARSIVANRYTVAETNSMTVDEQINFYQDCVNAEDSFFNKYHNTIFDDLNIQYLCNKYVDGIRKQKEACQAYLENKDIETYNNYWDSGYYNRAYVIVELTEYYNAPFTDISEMKTNTEAMDSLNEAETRNAAVDHAIVQKTQQLLNDIGFFCGNADGISGKRTVKSIKRFQEMYGYDPVDGMIDEELIAQLETELEKKK